MYSDDELLMISGIQHIAFCERQYALAYLEMQWFENIFTVEGRIFHDRIDNPDMLDESRRNVIVWRSLPLVSYTLGLYGRSDVVELILAEYNDPNSIQITRAKGKWKLVPVEYKRGKPKSSDCDKVQLCAQAMSLEEIYNVNH